MSALNLCSFEDFRYHASLKPSAHLMVILHGRGDSRLGLEFLRHGLKLDSMHYLLINAPDPWPIPFGAPGYSWYEMAPNQGPGIARSLLLLNQLSLFLQQFFLRCHIINTNREAVL